MKPKVLAVTGIVVIGLAYIAFKPKAELPVTVQEHKQAPIAKTTQDVAVAPTPTQVNPEPKPVVTAQNTAHDPEEKPAPTPVDITTQESLVENLKADKELTKVADITKVECLDGKCTVELESKGETSVQMKMLMFIRDHREEYGRFSTSEDSKENPRLLKFVISKEKL